MNPSSKSKGKGRVWSAWIVRTDDSSRRQLAESSVFFKKADAVECKTTCGDGFQIIKVKLTEVIRKAGK